MYTSGGSPWDDGDSNHPTGDCEFPILGNPDSFSEPCPPTAPSAGPSFGGGGGTIATTADFKAALAKLLQSPDCAKLLGGSAVAGSVLDGLKNVIDVSETGFIPRTPSSFRAQSLIKTGALAVNNSLPDKEGVWTGGGFAVFGGVEFSGNTFSAQLTIIIHELMHVAWSGTPFGSSSANGAPAVIDLNQGGRSSAYMISTNCGTDFPKYSLWTPIPTEDAQLPNTLQ